MIRLAVTLTCVLVASAAFAGVEFVLMDGERDLDGGEVCFYKTAASAANMSPGKYYFSGDEVRCLPAKTILDMPAGRLILFGRHPDGFVTANRQIRYDPKPTTEDCYQKLRLILVRAARIEVPKARDGERVGVWVTDSESWLGGFLPAVTGETSMLVPAGIPVIPMEVRGTELRRVGAPVTLKAGDRYVLPAFASAPGRGDVVAWLEADDETVRKLGKKSLSAAAMSLSLPDGKSMDSVTPLRHPGSYDGSLVIFKDVPAGKVTITSGGQFWTRDQVDVEVPSGGVAITTKPLRVLPAGHVRAVLPASVDSALTVGTCDAGAKPKFSAVLSKCAEGAETCQPVREATVADPRDGITLEGVRPGAYSLTVTLPNGHTVTKPVDVAIAEEREVLFDDVGLVVYGTVRRGGEPVRAELAFSTDDTAVTDGTGAFRALLKTSPGPHVVKVTTCAGQTYMHLPEQGPNALEPFNIEIPDNRVIAVARDRISNKGIPEARVKYAVLKDPADGDAEEFSIHYSQSAKADAGGEAAFRGVVPDKTIRVCATATGYEGGCSKPAVTSRAGEHKLEVWLRPTGTRRGLLVPEGIEHARVFLFARGGEMVAEAKVQPDGVFVYGPVNADGHAIVIAPDLPLTVVPLAPLMEGHDLVVAVPDVRARRFQVAVTSGRSARIGLIVGGTVIPPQVFMLHQNFRGLQSVLLPGRTLEVAEVSETAPIAVVLGQEVDDATLPADAVARREYVAGFPSQRLPPAADVVTFE